MTSVPSGHGPCRGVPRTVCVAGIVYEYASRPASARSGVTIVVLRADPNSQFMVLVLSGSPVVTWLLPACATAWMWPVFPAAAGLCGSDRLAWGRDERRAAPRRRLVQGWLLDEGHPCRSGPRSDDRRRGAADLRHLDVQAGRRRRTARRVRVLTFGPPD